MAPDFSRLSPLSGLKRLFGLHGVSELGKALLKCAGGGRGLRVDRVAGCSATCWRSAAWRRGRRSGAVPDFLSWAFVWLCASLALVAMVDVPLQLFQFKRSLRMTRQELRDESKEIGRPSRNQAAHPSDAADAGAAPHDAQGADRGRGDRQSDALRGGAQVRPEENARAARAGQGRRPGRAEHPPHRRGTPRAGIRVAEAGAGAVPIDRPQQGDPGRPVRGRGAGAVVHLQDAHLEPDGRGPHGAPGSASVGDEYEDA